MTPNVGSLSAHLPGQNTITLPESQSNATLKKNLLAKKERNGRTTLTAWFEVSNRERLQPLTAKERTYKGILLPESKDILYPDFVRYYTWNKSKKSWTRRKVQKAVTTVGRVFAAQPNEGERYYLRRMLYHVPGATCYEDLRTIENVTHDTYQAACRALGLLDDDTEWREWLLEAGTHSSARQLRALFTIILHHCNPHFPRELWDEFIDSFIEDYLHTRHKSFPDHPLNKPFAVNSALVDLADRLGDYGKTLSDYKLPEFSTALSLQEGLSSELYQELRFDPDKTKKNLHVMRESISKYEEQVVVFSVVCNQVDVPKKGGHIFFVDAPGGTGKSYVLNALLSYVRSKQQPALAMASSGMASLVLEGGKNCSFSL